MTLHLTEPPGPGSGSSLIAENGQQAFDDVTKGTRVKSVRHKCVTRDDPAGALLPNYFFQGQLFWPKKPPVCLASPGGHCAGTHGNAVLTVLSGTNRSHIFEGVGVNRGTPQ